MSTAISRQNKTSLGPVIFISYLLPLLSPPVLIPASVLKLFFWSFEFVSYFVFRFSCFYSLYSLSSLVYLLYAKRHTLSAIQAPSGKRRAFLGFQKINSQSQIVNIQYKIPVAFFSTPNLPQIPIPVNSKKTACPHHNCLIFSHLNHNMFRNPILEKVRHKTNLLKSNLLIQLFGSFIEFTDREKQLRPILKNNLFCER